MGRRCEVPRDETIARHVQHRHRTNPDSRDWSTSPELPQPEELMAIEAATLPQGPSQEECFDKQAYLGFHYATSRFEGIELSRRAVQEFRERPLKQDSDDFHVYTQVHVQGYLLAKSGPACQVSFSTECSESRIVWHQSSRLAPGKLVALSPSSDNFKTQCFVAIVADRSILGGLEPDFEAGENDNTPPRIQFFWASPDTAVIDPSVEMVMLETKSGFFESVRHAMVGLQHAAEFESKFDKYIIDGYNKERTAAYLAEDPELVVQIPDRAKGFDASQREAFNRMTSRELAVVQGPPGTGKTFTSVVALESYVRTLKAGQGFQTIPPVIVAAQTNHALDQLLERCLSFEAVIARLGSRTENEVIKPRTIYNIRKDSKFAHGPTRSANRKLQQIQKAIGDLLEKCFPTELIAADEFLAEELITQKQYDSLKDEEYENAPIDRQDNDEAVDSIKQWLGVCLEPDETYVYRPPRGQREPPEDQSHAVDESKQESDKERLRGTFFPIKFHMTGSVPTGYANRDSVHSRAGNLLKNHQDLYNVGQTQRGMVYRHLRERLIDTRAKRFPELIKAYQEACDENKIARWTTDAKILTNEKIEILGCTTTGLTKYRGLIAALGPRILMVEEAAETREANITSALFPSLDQIVLVGDHQQLVPRADVRELDHEPYNMKVSLFERLVYLGLPYTMLQVQRRMVPSIREVVNVFYHELTDHPSVSDPKNRPSVPGMGGQSLRWFHHSWNEAQNSDDFSYFNATEANMIVCFVRYLIQNGVAPKRITMLSFYQGQVNVLLETLRRDSTLAAKNPTKEWSVKTVDGFQGEENDIIILSIVRSARPGFVQNQNRAVVALSRAKCGLYIFGNALNLLRGETESYQTWSNVYDVFVRQCCFDDSLPVICENHKNRTSISSIEDWDTIAGGGCTELCAGKCVEGHPCTLTCHPFKEADRICNRPCERTLGCGHQCSSLCGEPCICGICKRSIPVRPLREPRAQRAEGLQAAWGKVNGRRKTTMKRNGRGGSVHRGSTHTGPSAFDRSAVRVNSHSNKPNVLLDQSVPAVEPTIREPTSEQLMEGGYYAEGGPAQYPAQRTAVVTPYLGTSPLSLKWSPAKVSQKEQEAKRAVQQTSPCSTTITTAFRPTTMGVDGSRRYGPKIFSSHTTPAPSPTRKQILHDAAAGKCLNEQQGTATKPVATRSETFDHEDLISFDQHDEQQGTNVESVATRSETSNDEDLISFD
ncbi:unnamed protein product [Fusarium equiseti]|uniref:Helicase n=1 Tax=Fusarium equiseti TaxID=61235 RepID=A0A8J2J972_FUSEQ|nr:unnamed protein product [Fusarium equiseti]